LLLGSNPFISHSQAEKTAEQCKNTCYCGERYIEDDTTINEIIVLDCGCCIHRTCLIQYIRYYGIERGYYDTVGIKCPNISNFSDNICEHPEKLITPDDIDTYLNHSTNTDADVYDEGNSMRQYDLDNREINKFREFMMMKQDNVLNPADSSLDPLIEAITKKCPNPTCNNRQTHFSRHSCHHLADGCSSCKIHYCWRCLQTGEMNSSQRGNKSSCLCPRGSWSAGCTPASPKNIILINGYPCNADCGCPICNLCDEGKPGKACNCFGDCEVCLGHIKKGPTDIADVGEWFARLNDKPDKYGFYKDGIHCDTKTIYNKYDFKKDKTYLDTTDRYNKYGFNIDKIHKDTRTQYDNNNFNIDSNHRFTGDKYDNHEFNIDGIHRVTGELINRYGFRIDKTYLDTRKMVDNEGFDIDGYDKYGFNRDHMHRNQTMYNDNGFKYDKTYLETSNMLDNHGFNIDGIYTETGEYVDRHGFNITGHYTKSRSELYRRTHRRLYSDDENDDYLDKFDDNGFNIDGIHNETGTPYNRYKFDRDGIHNETDTPYDKYDFDINGVHKDTKKNIDNYDFNRYGQYIDPITGNISRYNKYGFKRDRTYLETTNIYDENGFDIDGIHNVSEKYYDTDGYDIDRYDNNGFDIDGKHRDTQQYFDRYGFDTDSLDHYSMTQEEYFDEFPSNIQPHVSKTDRLKSRSDRRSDAKSESSKKEQKGKKSK